MRKIKWMRDLEASSNEVFSVEGMGVGGRGEGRRTERSRNTMHASEEALELNVWWLEVSLPG